MSLWGFADLHAHPASHLAFGANDLGENGIFWGKPGTRHDVPPTPADLPPCDVAGHSTDDAGPVRGGTRRAVIDTIERLGTTHHGPSGWPSFADWPKGGDILHQSMHVSWIHRAWQGGLRLMIASVTDNETLSMLWNRTYGASRPSHNPNQDYESARKQLSFLHALVAANSSWMQIARSSAEARAIVAANHLAIILGVEMDQLSVEQIVALKNEFDVRSVIPIHLTDNVFGGVAVYNDAFNTHNWFVNDYFFQVEADPSLDFHLDRPEWLKYLTNNPFWGGDLAKYGAMEPQDVDDSTYANLHYAERRGHKNARGLNSGPMVQLMREGLLIDVAHMSEKSQSGAIDLATNYHYPMMNSHTGLRPDVGRASDERAMKRGQAQRIASLGGVLGFGTQGRNSLTPWLDEFGDALNAMGNRGVALGTDMNGYAPQFARSEIAVNYPIDVAARSAAAAGASAENLDRSVVGTKTFDFTTDGVGHYGMLPDFLQALSQHPGAHDKVEALFRSAEDVVQMWERVEASSFWVGQAQLQHGWRWCNKCQGLYYGPNTDSRCPAGGAHEVPANSRSWDYGVSQAPLDDANHQSFWHWCNKCQGMFYGEGTGSHCPRGGPHASPTVSGSSSYTLAHGIGEQANWQSNWLWCNKCQGLFYGDVNGSRCPAGGTHASAAESNSWNYCVAHSGY